jgi:hypothetical protein
MARSKQHPIKERSAASPTTYLLTLGLRENPMTKIRPRTSRLHSDTPADAAWRSEQGHVDADIEGLARDQPADRLVAEMDAAFLTSERKIERLKEYFQSRRDPKHVVP